MEAKIKHHIQLPLHRKLQKQREERAEFSKRPRIRSLEHDEYDDYESAII